MKITINIDDKLTEDAMKVIDAKKKLSAMLKSDVIFRSLHTQGVTASWNDVLIPTISPESSCWIDACDPHFDLLEPILSLSIPT